MIRFSYGFVFSRIWRYSRSNYISVACGCLSSHDLESVYWILGVQWGSWWRECHFWRICGMFNFSVEARPSILDEQFAIHSSGHSQSRPCMIKWFWELNCCKRNVKMILQQSSSMNERINSCVISRVGREICWTWMKCVPVFIQLATWPWVPSIMFLHNKCLLWTSFEEFCQMYTFVLRSFDTNKPHSAPSG